MEQVCPKLIATMQLHSGPGGPISGTCKMQLSIPGCTSVRSGVQAEHKWHVQLGAQLVPRWLTRLACDVGGRNVLAAQHAVVQPQQAVPAGSMGKSGNPL